MADEISNKTLIVLLIVAIALSLGGALVSLNKLSMMRAPAITGYITNTGYANVSVNSNAAIRFTVSTLDFGTGYVNASLSTTCSMASNNASGYSDGTSVCVGFNPVATLKSLVIENYGNANLTVAFNSSKNATQMFGGPSRLEKFRIWVQENETGACTYGLVPNGWTDVYTNNTNICGDMSYNTSKNSLVVHVNLTVPYDVLYTLTGSERKATITATGTAD